MKGVVALGHGGCCPPHPPRCAAPPLPRRKEVSHVVLDAPQLGRVRSHVQREPRAAHPLRSHRDDLWLLATPTTGERTQEDYARAVCEHSDFCRSVAGTSKFPLGRIVSVPDPLDPRDFSYTQIVTWVSKPERALRTRLGDRLVRRARGTYAVILHQGGTSSAWQSYEKLLAFVRDEGLEADGPLYELDVNSYLMSDSADDYLLHISLKVK